MPYRSPTLETNEFYHIFNRSIAYEKIFKTMTYKNLFMNLIFYYNSRSILPHSFLKNLSNGSQNILDVIARAESPGIEIVAYAVMPTHFHLILKQTKDGEISRYLRRLEVSYAKSYNCMKVRHGGVFSGRFGSVKIKSQNQLHVAARYIFLNPIKAKIITIEELDDYPYTSFHCLGEAHPHIKSDYILEGFEDAHEFSQYVKSGYIERPEYLPEEM